MHSFLRFGKESPVAKNMKKWGMGMVTLNDYLYSGDTVLKIIQRFQNDLNDGCGLYRGRLILPYEHLSRFQNDIID